MATFRSKYRISRKDKKRLKKQDCMRIENIRQANYFFSNKNSCKAYEIAKKMLEV